MAKRATMDAQAGKTGEDTINAQQWLQMDGTGRVTINEADGGAADPMTQFSVGFFVEGTIGTSLFVTISKGSPSVL